MSVFRLITSLTLVIMFSLTTISLPIYGSEEAGLFNVRTLSVEIATKAAWGALRECRRRGYSVAVAVVDRGGNVQVLLRDRFAGPHTPETAIRKAWTANSFRQSTAELAGLLKDKRIPSQVAHNPGALLVGGGLMIESGGQTVGGIGISGAPPGKTERDSIDGDCARTGIKKIQDVLDFGE